MLEPLKSLLEDKINDLLSTMNKSDVIPIYKILNLVSDLISQFNSGNKVLIFGNGGSAAEAMHIAAEFTGKCILDHRPLPVLCLNESQSSITAITNDFGFEEIFSRNISAFAEAGDIVIGLSTSGKSKNVLKGLEMALEKRCKVILWTGDQDVKMKNIEIWKAPTKTTPRIQEIHLIWGHLISELVEEALINLV